MTDHPKLKLVIAGMVAAALLGTMDLLAQLSSTKPDRRTLTLLLLTWVTGVGFGGFAGYYFAEPLRDYLTKYGITDSVAVAALLGLVIVPLAPAAAKALARRVASRIDNSGSSL